MSSRPMSRWGGALALALTMAMVLPAALLHGCDPCPKCVKPVIKPTPTPTPSPSLALVAGGGNASAEIYASASKSFTCVGGLAPGGGCAPVMSASRANQTATLLNSGAVLVAGGFDVSNGAFLASADLFVSPSAGFAPVTAAMTMARAFDAAAPLASGEVLIAGGFDSLTTELATAELYDPATQTFSRTGPMVQPRAYFTLTPLPNGTVLAAGGAVGVTGSLSTAEIYNPASGTFSCVGGVNPATGVCNQSMSDARAHFTATLLNDGTILVAGGIGNSGTSLDRAEIYDPASGTFSCVGGVSATPPLCNPSMVSVRADHAATLLNDGTVLISGGIGSDVAIASAEIYDPATRTFAATGSMNVARSTHTATLLKDGTVLIAGGLDMNGVPLASAEIYNPSTKTFTLTGSMTEARTGHTATLLP